MEDLVLDRDDGASGTGNSLDNRIFGGGGDDVLSGGGGIDILNGGPGNDLLDGGSGNDFLSGGEGDDTYVIDNASDTIEETGGSLDTVRSSISFTLANGSPLENLELVGSNAINGTGNSIDNTIIGNSAKNTLDGGAGNDRLIGKGGDDTLVGQGGDDILTGGGGNDILTAGSGFDGLNGGAGADRFRFNAPNEQVDVILDFGADDVIQVSAAGFKGRLTAGSAISADQFRLGSAAGDANDRFIYASNFLGAGALFFDPDGTGSAPDVRIAALTGSPTITAADIVVI